MNIKSLLMPIALAQAWLGARVAWRMLRSAGGERIQPVDATGVLSEDRQLEKALVSVIVPVLNERRRLSPCLDGLIAQGSEVCEIVVVDGGSTDGTQRLVDTYTRRDQRVRLLDASPIPLTWNGKAWGLQVGLRTANPCCDWVLTIDADVRPGASLARTLLSHAHRTGLAALSVATLQEIESVGEGLLHPSMLTTLVYRFGMPGKVFRRVSEVQANGQCFLFNRAGLETCGGFQGGRDSLCEDVTLARSLVVAGYRVGFYEVGDLVTVKMYEHWRDAWRNWTRSLPMRDRYSGINTLLGWLEVLFVQALPLPLFFFLVAARFARTTRRPHRSHRWIRLLNAILALMRLGVLSGTARAYQRRPWSYWLSPLCDLPVTVQLGRSALRSRHLWRGRVLLRGGMQ